MSARRCQCLTTGHPLQASLQNILNQVLSISTEKVLPQSGHSYSLLTESARPFSVVQSIIAEAIKGRILVGHSLWHDLSGVILPDVFIFLEKMDANVHFRFVVLGIPHPAAGQRLLLWALMGLLMEPIPFLFISFALFVFLSLFLIF